MARVIEIGTGVRTGLTTLDWVAIHTHRLAPDRNAAVTFQSRTGVSALHISGHDPARVHASAAATLWRGVFFDGVLYNRRELEQRCGESHRRLSDATLLLRAWQFWGTHWLKQVKGVFAVLAWDSTAGTLMAARDPLGTYPLFYARGTSGFLLSTSISALVGREGVSSAVNRLALADHLARRWPDPHETFFEAVRRVPPGHRLDVTLSRERITRYWDPTPADEPSEWIKEDELEQFDDLLDNAVARCYRQGRTGVFLNGGLDSLSVAAVAADGARRDHYAPPLILSLAPDSEDPTSDFISEAGLGSVAEAGLASIAKAGPAGSEFPSEAGSEFISEADPRFDPATAPNSSRPSARDHVRQSSLDDIQRAAAERVQVVRALGLPHEVLRFGDDARAEGVLAGALKLTASWPTPILNTWLPAYSRLAERGLRRGVSVILTGRGAEGWLSLSPYLSADLMTRLDVVAWCRFVFAWKRSYEGSWPALVHSALSTYGAKPLASRVIDQIFPAPWRLSRVRRVMKNTPKWVAPDRLFRRELWDRAQHALMPLHPPRGFYLQDLGNTMGHAVTSLELEADFELGRRLGVKILHPYRDADLVTMLYRTPPRLLNRHGRPTRLVQDSVARRFPSLDRDFGRHAVDRQTPSFFRTALTKEADAEWKRLGGVEALADLRIVDPIAAAKAFEDGKSGKSRPEEPAGDRRWDILSAETWVRAHS